MDSCVSLLRLALDLDTGTVLSTSRGVVLYVVRLMTKIESAMAFLYNMAMHVRELQVSPAVMEALRVGLHRLRALLRGEAGRAHDRSVLNMLKAWLREIVSKTPVYSNGEVTAKEGATSSRMLDDDDGEPEDNDPRAQARKLDEYTRIAADLHAHILWVYRSLSQEDMTAANVGDVLASFIYLSTRHTWNQDFLTIPETEIFEIMQTLRRPLTAWLERPRGREVPADMRAEFAQVLQLVYLTAIGEELKDPENPMGDTNPVWCYVDGPRNHGRFVVTKRKRLVMKNANEIPVVKDGIHVVEVDIQTLELRVRGQSLRALDTDIARNSDIKHLFGDSAGTMQCTVESDNENRKVSTSCCTHWKFSLF